jgi:hypothetical protein
LKSFLFYIVGCKNFDCSENLCKEKCQEEMLMILSMNSSYTLNAKKGKEEGVL